MIGSVLPLIQTLLDIIRFRKGPDAIPYSPVLFILVVTLWFATGLVAALIAGNFDAQNYWSDLMISIVGVSAYAAVIVSFGMRSRMTQALTALFGCAALLSLAFAFALTFLSLIFDQETALSVAILIAFWSVAVDGFILARTLNRQLLVGLIIAIGVFLVQLQISFLVRPPATGAL